MASGYNRLCEVSKGSERQAFTSRSPGVCFERHLGPQRCLVETIKQISPIRIDKVTQVGPIKILRPNGELRAGHVLVVSLCWEFLTMRPYDFIGLASWGLWGLTKVSRNLWCFMWPYAATSSTGLRDPCAA